jgi:NAD(P)-dependent dehydrogenase (short-subunit alcohol dehydrogenase family)
VRILRLADRGALPLAPWRLLMQNQAMRELVGKTALVTGAAGGIGRATAQALAREGARVVICDVNQAALGVVATSLADACLRARRVDVSDRVAMRGFADEVHELVPALDILVNNAGVGLQGGLLVTSLDDWDWILSINLGGVIHGCHFFVPRMVERGQGGHVVNMASALGLLGAPDVLGYATSKFGVCGLSESIRAELAPHRIGVSTICPGMIDTSIIANARFAAGVDANVRNQRLRKRARQIYKMRSYGPERVAHAIVDAIRNDRAVVPVAPEAWALYYVKRFFPALSGPLGRFVAKHAQ